MLEAYYDVYYKDRFEEFFKGKWIYDNPTPEKGAYLVMKFNFSMVDPALDRVGGCPRIQIINEKS